MKIIITIPAYNETESLEKTILEIRQVMNTSGYYDYLIVICDDGSTDGTSIIAKKIADVVYTNNHHQGLARMFQEEMNHCLSLGGDIIVHTDADGQYPAKSIPLLIEKIIEGHDLVIGSRFLDGINYGNSKLKAMGNILFSKFISAMSGKKVTDTTSGFRAMNRKVATNIKIRSSFTYTYDQYLQAVRNQYSIIEVPIEGSKTRKSKLMRNILHYMLRALWDIFVCFKRKHDETN